jgi:hypothetical protein
MTEKCAFCPATANITGEHVWSDWMNKLFRAFGSTNVTFQKVLVDGSIAKQWNAPKLNMKANVVCGTCNNGWMSNLEEQYAKPAMADLILGKRIGSIIKKRAHGLSLFAFKTAVIANHSLPENELFFDQSARYAFRASLKIPPEVRMWLVGMEPVAGGAISSLNVHFPDKDAPNLTLNICSFRVGCLGFQVVSAKAIRAGEVESLPTPDNLTTCFYPTLEPNVRWPRPKVLSTEAFNDFSNRWNAIRRW